MSESLYPCAITPPVAHRRGLAAGAREAFGTVGPEVSGDGAPAGPMIERAERHLDPRGGPQ